MSAAGVTPHTFPDSRLPLGMLICKHVHVAITESEAAAELFKTLSAPVRVAIVLALSESPMAVNALVTEVGVSQTLVSQHLRILRSAHLVGTSRQGREVVYHLVDEHVSHIVLDAVAHMKENPDACTS